MVFDARNLRKKTTTREQIRILYHLLWTFSNTSSRSSARFGGNRAWTCFSCHVWDLCFVLFDYPCLFISSGNKFAPISMKNRNCLRGRTKREFSSATWISTKTKTKKKFRPFRVDRFCLLWWVFYLALCYWGKPALIIKEDKALLSFGRRWWSVSPRSSVSLCEKADPPPTTHQSFHPRRRRHPTKKKTKGCSVLFRSFSDRQNTKERSTTTQERI